MNTKEPTYGDRGRCPLPDGGALAYEADPAATSTTPVLLVRPLGGSLALWGRFRMLLAREFPVIAFDARGGGRSTGAPRLSTHAMARDALTLLEHLGIERAHVYGQSLGGMIATRLAATAPTRVATMSLASTATSGAAFSGSGIYRGAQFAACFARPGDEVEACLADRIVSSAMQADGAGRQRLADAKAILHATPTSRAALVAQAIAGATHFAHDAASTIVAPTLVLAGELDNVLGTAPQQALARAIGNSTFDVIAGAGHDIALERPDEVAARVVRFLRQAASHGRSANVNAP